MNNDNPQYINQSLKEMHLFITEYYLQPFLNTPNFLKRFLLFPTFQSPEIVSESLFLLVKITELRSETTISYLVASGLLNLLQYFYSTSYYSTTESFGNYTDIQRLKYIFTSNLLLFTSSSQLIIRNLDKAIESDIKIINKTSKIFKYAAFLMAGIVQFGQISIETLIYLYYPEMDNDVAFAVLNAIYDYQCHYLIKNLPITKFGKHLQLFSIKRQSPDARKVINAILKILINIQLDLNTVQQLAQITEQIIELIKNEDPVIQIAGWQLTLTLSCFQEGAESLAMTWLLRYILRGISVINRQEPIQILQNLYFHNVIVLTTPEMVVQICDYFRSLQRSNDKEKQIEIVEILKFMGSDYAVHQHLLNCDIVTDLRVSGFEYDATYIENQK
eukprot:EST42096.1 Hypothetical protein SS50377_18405 [Spironucleus salmonicida]